MAQSYLVPLPPQQFSQDLNNVFACTDKIAAIFHNRDERITFENLQSAIQGMTKKFVVFNHLKRIRTVFPAAYHFKWEQKRGKFGRKLKDYELNITVNTDFKKETGEANVLGGKLGPKAATEIMQIFTENQTARL